MPPAPATNYPSMLESHESRLQAVEATSSETRTDVATALVQITALKDATAVQTETLTKSMSENQGHVMEKLEDGFKRVTERLDPISAKTDKLIEGHALHGVRIKELEAKSTARAASRKRFRSVIWGLLLAGAGVGIEEGVKWLLTKL